MQSQPDDSFVSTKAAGKFSGYSRAHIARLARLNRFRAKKIGRLWLVEQKSLEYFLSRRVKRRKAHVKAYGVAKDLALAVQSRPSAESAESHTWLVPVSRELSWRARSPVLSEALALSVAVAVLCFGALGAPVFSRVTTALGTDSVREATSYAFGLVASLVMPSAAPSITKVAVHAEPAAVAASLGTASALDGHLRSIEAQLRVDGLLPVFPTVASARIVSPDTRSAESVGQSIRAGLFSLYTRVTHPAIAGTALAHAYTVFGVNAYGAIAASLGAYLSSIDALGVEAFDLAHATRSLLPEVPTLVANMNLSLGAAVIHTTHAAIGADVAVAYRLAEAGPESARVTVTFIGTIGDALARATERAPTLAVSLARAAIANTGSVAYEGARFVRGNMRSFFGGAEAGRFVAVGARLSG